jgi:hypothetical protein
MDLHHYSGEFQRSTALNKSLGQEPSFAPIKQAKMLESFEIALGT